MSTKIKRLFPLILAVLLIFSRFSVSVGAADAKAVLKFKVSDDGKAIVYDCDTAAKGVVSVPDRIKIKSKTYAVKYIGDKAFDKCKKITVIKIPEGVTSIGSYAFRSCTALKEVYIPESLIRCEPDAFKDCSDVKVHCYTANYQFISLCGSYSNVEIDIIDEDNIITSPAEEKDFLDDFGFVGRFIKALRDLIQDITDYFGVDEEDFTVEDLPFDLPFDLPEEENSVLGDILGVDF